MENKLTIKFQTILYYIFINISAYHDVFAANPETYSGSASVHSGGPGGIIDYIIVLISFFMVVIVFVLFMKYLIWPGEKSPDHIKRRILRDYTEKKDK